MVENSLFNLTNDRGTLVDLEDKEERKFSGVGEGEIFM